MPVEIDDVGNEIHRNFQNQIHNLEGPATISRYKNGKISCESWFKNDLCHREDGPSVTVFDYDSNGRQFIIYEGYYLNGKSMTAQDHRDAWDFSNNNYEDNCSILDKLEQLEVTEVKLSYIREQFEE